MPDQPSWTHRVPQILTELAQPGPAFLDRTAIERVFGLSPRQANRIMRDCPGGYVIGRSLVVPRAAVSAFVQTRIDPGATLTETRRRERLYETLADARNEAKRRRIIIPVKQDTFSRTFDDLPPGITFQPGLLQISFASPVELLEKLFELAQALGNDLGRIDDLV